MDLTRVLQFAPEAFVLLDEEFRVRYLNAAAERLLAPRAGAKSVNYLGALAWEALPVVVEGGFEAPVRQALSAHSAVTFNASLDHGARQLEASSYPTDGGLVICFREVT